MQATDLEVRTLIAHAHGCIGNTLTKIQKLTLKLSSLGLSLYKNGNLSMTRFEYAIYCYI